MLSLIDKNLNEYAENHTFAETEVLKELNRETHLKVMTPQMLSGHLQGSFLSFLSHITRPLNILEIGTYTGYSAICLASGLQKNGKLITIDINEELESMVRKYFKKAGLENRIDYKIGNALDIIPQLNTTFDLVFIDADKINYVNYFDLVINKVNTNGLIIADNVLWSGKVIQKNPDEDTKALQEFNDKVHKDKRVENILLAVRDGLMLMRKI